MIEMDVLGGSEYYRLNGGQSVSFINSLARDVLGSELTAGPLKRYAYELAHGVGRRAVAASVLSSLANRQILTQQLFNEVLFRSATPVELSRWTTILKTSRGRATAVARLVNTNEFRAIAGVKVVQAREVVKSTPVKTVQTVSVQSRPFALGKKAIVSAKSAHPTGHFSKGRQGVFAR